MRGRGAFFAFVVFASVPICERALAVDGRVQYTGSMLWKFKRSETPQPSTSPVTPAPSVSNQVPQSHSTGSPSRVANEDALVGHPEGYYVVPASYRITGSLVTHRPVVLEGELQGDRLVAPSVHVRKSGRLTIPTQAAAIIIEGAVDSPISARENVEVRAGGVVRGDVEAGGLSILPGGVVSGARLAIGPLRKRHG